MCGLVGVFGKDINYVDEKVARQLSIVSSLRGDHSTGLMYAWEETRGKDKGTCFSCMHKSEEVPSVFNKSKKVQDIYRIPNLSVLAYHTRYATKGQINSENAHPFEHGEYKLMHNGTVQRAEMLHGEGALFDTDSESITYAFSKLGPAKVIPEINGAFALAWIHSPKGTFHLIRNSERGLFICKNSNREVYYYASEKLMLDLVLTRNKINYTEPEKLETGKEIIYDFVVGGKIKERKHELREDKFKNQWFGYLDYGYGSASTKKTGYQRESTQSTYPVLGPAFQIPEKLGIKRGDKILFWPYEIKRPFGFLGNVRTIEGMFMDPESPDILIRASVLSSDFTDEELDEILYEECVGEFTYAEWDNNSNSYVLRVQGIRPIERDDDGSIIGEEGVIEALELPKKDREKLRKSRDDGRRSTKAKNNVIELKPKEDKKALTHEMYEGPDGKMLTSEEFDELVKHGCAMCTQDILCAADVAYWKGDSPLCFQCAMGEGINTNEFTRFGRMKVN